MKAFNILDIDLTKHLFFTGKGGVGKTSIACATAVGLADKGKKILLISTDPASNLQDVFNQSLNGHGSEIAEVPGLTVVNLDPEQAAAEYRERVIAPFRGKLPESVIQNMEEQLSGSCTVEIAAFNEFSDFITDTQKQLEFDHIIFDTAPTGHTLRMLQLPSAWSTFISESTHGASCLGQLSGLEERKEIYKKAVETLSDASTTRLMLVSRPDIAPLKEAARSSHELQLLGIKNQILIINGVLQQLDKDDSVSNQLHERQQKALQSMPTELSGYPLYYVPLRSYNLSSIANIRRMLYSDSLSSEVNYKPIVAPKGVDELVNDLYTSGKRVIFTMGNLLFPNWTTGNNTALSLKYWNSIKYVQWFSFKVKIQRAIRFLIPLLRKNPFTDIRINGLSNYTDRFLKHAFCMVETLAKTIASDWSNYPVKAIRCLSLAEKKMSCHWRLKVFMQFASIVKL